jgi:peptidylprolyl isomerase
MRFCPLVPRPRLRTGLGFPLASVTLVVGLAACDSLTTPPEPVAIAVTTTTAAAAPPASAAPAASAAAPAPTPPPADPNAKLVSTDVVVGKGTEAKTGSHVSVHYVGTLADGKEFDSSRKRGKPFVFTLGQGSVIRGWDQGVVGMKVGGRRELIIPASLGYGSQSPGSGIAPNDTLVFMVDLLKIN